MKTIRLTLVGTIFSILALTACQRDFKDELFEPATTDQQAVNQSVSLSQGVNPNGYSITLLGPTQVNSNWEWIWAIKNNNPGNGNNGTTQDLSHWGMTLGACMEWSSVIAAAYSKDGVHWNSFNPTLQVDPSGCLTSPVIKFDYGTEGSNTSYFRLILNKYYPEGGSYGYYKSGRNTGCIPFAFRGVGCEEDTESQ